MKIQNISIKNYKSLVDLEINNPSPFTVFVGSNASGKSNILEALDFFYHFIWLTKSETLQLFGGQDELVSRIGNKHSFTIKVQTQGAKGSAILNVLNQHSNISLEVQPVNLSDAENTTLIAEETPGIYARKAINDEHAFIEFWKWKYFTRVFIRHKEVQRFSITDDQRLSSSCDNLEKVLKRLLKDERKREEIIEWLQLFIPEFENIDAKIPGDALFIYEKGIDKPFPFQLISDGAYNIISILTAVFQCDEPQFLCIEEPENGIHSKVVKELVGFFREQCKEKGHFIWLNTHSQTLIRELTTDEIIIVDKIEGKTKTKQLQSKNLHGLRMDEALFSGVLGGGIPW